MHEGPEVSNSKITAKYKNGRAGRFTAFSLHFQVPMLCGQHLTQDPHVPHLTLGLRLSFALGSSPLAKLFKLSSAFRKIKFLMEKGNGCYY